MWVCVCSMSLVNHTIMLYLVFTIGFEWITHHIKSTLKVEVNDFPTLRGRKLIASNPHNFEGDWNG